MKIHQAVYGEQNGAHGLIASSSAQGRGELPFTDLVALTDRAGDPPPALRWEPYTSGYPYQRWYVISRTFPDKAASRAGMVLTHALLLPLEEACECSRLDDIMRLLPARASRPGMMDELEMPGQETGPVSEPTQNIEDGRLAEMARCLLRSSRSGFPTVWIGQDGFDAAISRLWRRLWPQARKTFRFRLSFGPMDTEGQGLTAVCTPGSLENRWNQPFAVVPTRAAASANLELSEAYLLGLAEGEPLRELHAEIGTPLGSLFDLIRIEDLWKGLARLPGIPDADEARRYARLLGALAPSPEQAPEAKGKVLRRLAELTEVGSAKDVCALRNFDFLPFQGGEPAIFESFQTWLRSAVREHDKVRLRGFARVLTMAFSSQTAWGNLVRRAVSGMVAAWLPGTVPALWIWWVDSPDLISALADTLPVGMDIEEGLAAGCPSGIPASTADRLAALSQQRPWYLLHAVALSAGYPLQEAIHRHLAFDSDPDRDSALRSVANRLDGENLLLAALGTGEERLLRLAGERSARESGLLTTLDVAQPAWRKVWLHSIRSGGAVFAGTSDPTARVYALLDVIVSGTAVEDELLAAVSRFPEHADLTEYPGRRRLWPLLPEGAAAPFLTATASGWLHRWISSPELEPELGAPLQDAVQAEAVRWLSGSKASASLTIILFRRFPHLGERQFIRWLDGLLVRVAYVGEIDVIILGRYVAERQWSEVAQSLMTRISAGRRDLVPAIQECRHLLGLMSQIKIAWTWKTESITESKWWGALLEVGAELYPRGIEEREIWKRAGGDVSITPVGSPGQSQWQTALADLGRGGGGKGITVDGLLHQMRQDFPRNDKLGLLQDIRASLWRVRF